ncbi:hypothetical protein [Paenibacillus sp. FSL R5-0908]|nr:hypothetical protein BSK60_32925 [Paenibacillus odorifer]
METLFFDSNETLDNIVPMIFNELNITSTVEGENSSFINNTYFEGSVLGIVIRIAENNYDYEDDFNYMISIKKSIGMKLRDEDGLYLIAEIISSVIAMKLNINVAVEKYCKESDSNYLLYFNKNGNELLVEKR